MVEKSRRDRVGLGLIGLGPSWEQVYRDRLLRMQNRLTIRLVYDPVAARAKTIATDLGAQVAGSLRQILNRHTIQGLLILDPGWCKFGILDLVTQSEKPIFFGSPFLKSLSDCVPILNQHSAFQDSLESISHHNDQWMPEFGLRFTPASCRLRELIATKLGSVKHMEIHCDRNQSFTETVTIVDWFCDIIGTTLHRCTRTSDDRTGQPVFDFEFPTLHSSGGSQRSNPRTVRLRYAADCKTPVKFDVKCEHGQATITGRTRISWHSPPESADESLNDERNETEILIDQFCRRALGGLNPVGRFCDFSNAIKIVSAMREPTVSPSIDNN